MPTDLDSYQTDFRQARKLKYEKARRTALGVAQGVVLSDLDQQQREAQRGEGMVRRQFQREEETARLAEVQREGARQRDADARRDVTIQSYIDTPFRERGGWRAQRYWIQNEPELLSALEQVDAGERAALTANARPLTSNIEAASDAAIAAPGVPISQEEAFAARGRAFDPSMTPKLTGTEAAQLADRLANGAPAIPGVSAAAQFASRPVGEYLPGEAFERGLERIGNIPYAGKPLRHAAEFATSPQGIGFGVAAPAFTAQSLAGGVAAGTAGGVAEEELGAPRGTAALGELAGTFAGPVAAPFAEIGFQRAAQSARQAIENQEIVTVYRGAMAGNEGFAPAGSGFTTDRELAETIARQRGTTVEEYRIPANQLRPKEWYLESATDQKPVRGLGKLATETGGTRIRRNPEEPMEPLASARKKFSNYSRTVSQRRGVVEAQRSTERSARAAEKQALVNEFRAQGLSYREALERSDTALAGKYPGFLSLPQLELSPEEANAIWETIARQRPFEQKRLTNLMHKIEAADPAMAPQKAELALAREVLGDEFATMIEATYDSAKQFAKELAKDYPREVRLPRPQDLSRGSGLVEVPSTQRSVLTGEAPDIRELAQREATSALSEAYPREISRGEAALKEALTGQAAEFPQAAIIAEKALPASARSPLANALDVLKVPQAFKQAWDFSFHLRQAAKSGFRNPKEWWDSLVADVNAFKSEKVAQEYDAAMKGDTRMIKLMTPDGIKEVPYGQVSDEFMGNIRSLDAGDDEFFMSLAAHKLGTRPSERGFITAGNKMRHDVGWKMVQRVIANERAITPERLRNIGNLNLRLTGRGELGQGNIAGLLRAVEWAPGYRVSGPQAFAQLLHPDAFIRRQALENLAAWFAGGTGMMGLAYLSGKTVGVDPFSSEFGKIRVGNTSYSIWGTDQVLARTIAQMIKGEKHTREGSVIPVNLGNAAWNYVRSGLDPVVGTAVDIKEGKNIVREPRNFNTAEGRKELFLDQLPLAAQDIRRIWENDGPLQALTSAPFIALGGGATSYTQDAGYKARSFPKYEGVTPEQEKQITEYKREVEYEWNRAQAQGVKLSRAEIADFLGQATGRVELGKLTAADYRDELPVNKERIQYAIDHQDELSPGELKEIVPDDILRTYLTQKNFERVFKP